jgi:hypothetical protein
MYYYPIFLSWFLKTMLDEVVATRCTYNMYTCASMLAKQASPLTAAPSQLKAALCCIVDPAEIGCQEVLVSNPKDACFIC